MASLKSKPIPEVILKIPGIMQGLWGTTAPTPECSIGARGAAEIKRQSRGSLRDQGTGRKRSWSNLQGMGRNTWKRTRGKGKMVF